MPPRSNSYVSVSNVSYDDQYSDTDNDYCTHSTHVSTPSLAKSVGFSSQVETCFVECIDDYTADEIAAVWYDKKDFEQMKIEILEMVRVMKTETRFPSDKASTRGLEHRTREGALSKFQNKKNSFCAVLDEQDFQWANDINDPDAIAKVYMEHSAPCKDKALQIGRSDAVAAQRVHHFTSINKYQRRSNKNKVKR